MLPVPELVRRPAAGFPSGRTAVTRPEDRLAGASFTLGLAFDLCRLPRGESLAATDPLESAWVLLRGDAELEFGGARHRVTRASLFDEPPTTLHLSAGTPCTIHSRSDDTEWAVVRTANARSFAPRLFTPREVTPEYRGAGLVQNACLRNVRLIFDRAARPESNLVLGEVVNYPGRWSSYPPHHHDQPEIYHYRFTAPEGYGHAEIGDDVVKVREGDTIVIPPGRDHAQVSAPGYGMYYLWMIRHLPGNPYTGFTFTEAHKWTLDAAQQGWKPADMPKGFA
jgi:5-deoxy-glucuronate isomerase